MSKLIIVFFLERVLEDKTENIYTPKGPAMKIMEIHLASNAIAKVIPNSIEYFRLLKWLVFKRKRSVKVDKAVTGISI